MQRRFKYDPEKALDEYINMVVENLSLESLTTEQLTRELTVFTLTLLTAGRPKTVKAGA